MVGAQNGRLVGGRVVGDWFDAELPANADIHPTTHLFSTYAFNHYHSTRPCGVRVGDNCGLYQATMFELGPHGQVEIGSYCVLNGPVFAGNSRIVIGSYCYLSYEVFLADTPFPQPSLSNHSAASSDEPVIVVGDDCWLGLRSVLLRGAHLGKGVIVGAGSVVDFAVDDYSVVVGNPARVVGQALPGDRRRASMTHDIARLPPDGSASP